MILSIISFVAGIVLVILGADWLTKGASALARRFNMSELLIGLTIVAIGTSLPELAASIAAAVKKNTDMALGNIIGSNIFNITFILGISSQVMPLTSSDITLVDYSVMIAAAVLPLIIGSRGRIGRLSGLSMIVCFVLYNWYLITNQIS